jgi:hypothetical protein
LHEKTNIKAIIIVRRHQSLAFHVLSSTSHSQNSFFNHLSRERTMADPLASPRPHLEERKSFMPKQPVELEPPKNDPITYDQLKENDGTFRLDYAAEE